MCNGNVAPRHVRRPGQPTPTRANADALFRYAARLTDRIKQKIKIFILPSLIWTPEGERRLVKCFTRALLALACALRSKERRKGFDFVDLRILIFGAMFSTGAINKPPERQHLRVSCATNQYTRNWISYRLCDRHCSGICMRARWGDFGGVPDPVCVAGWLRWFGVLGEQGRTSDFRHLTPKGYRNVLVSVSAPLQSRSPDPA